MTLEPQGKNVSDSNQPPYDPNNPYGQQQPPYGQDPYGQQPPYGGPPPGAPVPGAPFSPTDSFGWAWKKFTEDIGLFIVLGLLAVIPSAAVQSVFSFSGATGDNLVLWFSPFQIAAGIVGGLVSFIFMAAIAKTALAAGRGGKPTLSDAFDLNWSAVAIAGLVYAAAVQIGSLLCVLPGIAAAFLLLFTPMIAADGRVSDGIEALKGSFKLTTENVGPSLLVALLSICAVVVGLIACCVGIFVALPITVYAMTHTYLHLTGEGVAQTA